MLLPRFSSVSTLALLGEVLVAALSLHQTPNSQMVSIDALQSPDNRTKVPGQSPAYHCSNPTDDVFKIRQLDFIPTNPRIGYPLTVRFIGNFLSSTGDDPWLNITGAIDGRPERSPLYYSPLCDIDVFQEMVVQSPTGDYDQNPRLHRSCPPNIQSGYAVVSSPPMPLTPLTVPEGTYDIRAEATTQEGGRVFCVEGSFDVTK